MSFFLSGLNRNQQRLFGILILPLKAIAILPLNIFFELRSGRVVIVQRDADPRELYPDPSFVIVQGRFDFSQPIVLFYPLEGHGCERVVCGGDGGRWFVNVEVHFLIATGVVLILLFLHELFDIFEVEVPELVFIHRHVNVKLFNF